MGLSIQDNLKKINSWLAITDIVSIFVTFLTISLFAMYISYVQVESRSEVMYKENFSSNLETATMPTDNKPFGSQKSKTYTFSWCQGATRISVKNKIYFSSTEEAKAQGRTLSKLCKK